MPWWEQKFGEEALIECSKASKFIRVTNASCRWSIPEIMTPTLEWRTACDTLNRGRTL